MSAAVNAALTHASEPKRKRDENGKVISNEAADSDASYTSKRGVKHHGYKVHIATDTAGVIKAIRTTTAKVHDSQIINKLIHDEKKAVFADSGYMSQERCTRRSHLDTPPDLMWTPCRSTCGQHVGVHVDS